MSSASALDGIELDDNGNIYVSELLRRAIWVLSPDGSQRSLIASKAKRPTGQQRKSALEGRGPVFSITHPEGDCSTFSAVSDTRCSTYLIFTAFLTAVSLISSQVAGVDLNRGKSASSDQIGLVRFSFSFLSLFAFLHDLAPFT